MEYQEFLQVIKVAVEQQVPNEYRVSLNEVVKNNNQKLDGLTIIKKNGCMAPNIYLNRYYEEFLQGREIESIVKEVIRISNQAHGNTLDVPVDILDLDSVLGKITYRLINLEMNQERLKGMPHKVICDLAKVYNIVVKSDTEGISSIAVTNALMEKWDIQLEQIDKRADQNTPVLLPETIKTMKEILLAMFLGRSSELERRISLEDKEVFDQFLQEISTPSNEPDEMEMYILSNSSNVNGASAMLYPGILHEFAMTYLTNLYILPSSVHEVILIPTNCKLSKEGLCQMVRDINLTQVPVEEVLSNEIYFYDLQQDKLSIAVDC